MLLAPLLLYQKSGMPQLIRSTGLLKRLSPRLAAMETLLPPVTIQSFQDNLPTVVAAQGKQRYRVGMILGCVQRLFLAR